MLKFSISSLSTLSNEVGCKFEIFRPNDKCTSRHSVHRMTPIFKFTHCGPGQPQSAHSGLSPLILAINRCRSSISELTAFCPFKLVMVGAASDLMLEKVFEKVDENVLEYRLESL